MSKEQVKEGGGGSMVPKIVIGVSLLVILIVFAYVGYAMMGSGGETSPAPIGTNNLATGPTVNATSKPAVVVVPGPTTGSTSELTELATRLKKAEEALNLLAAVPTGTKKLFASGVAAENALLTKPKGTVIKNTIVKFKQRNGNMETEMSGNEVSAYVLPEGHTFLVNYSLFAKLSGAYAVLSITNKNGQALISGFSFKGGYYTDNVGHTNNNTMSTVIDTTGLTKEQRTISFRVSLEYGEASEQTLEILNMTSFNISEL